MPRSRSVKFGLIVAGLVVAAGIVLVLVFQSLDQVSKNTNTSNSNANVRSEYALLYEAAWRPDQQDDAILMTATLFTPKIISALGQDAGRSSAEDQIWLAVKDVPDTDVALVVTFDSVTGAVADDSVKEKLALTSTPSRTWNFKSWTPLVAPSRIVNTSQSATSQIGVLVMSVDQSINWSGLTSMQLEAKNIGRKPSRIFTWTQATWALTD